MHSSSLICLLDAVAVPDAGHDEWEELYSRLWPYTLAIIYRSVYGNRGMAEDLCQEVMLRLVRSLRHQDFAPSATLSFIREVCRSVIVDSRRKERSFIAVASPEAVPSAKPSPEAQAIESNLAESVRSRLTRNDAKLAQLVGAGASVDVIAETLAISRETAYVRRYRLKKRVREIVDELGATA